MKNEGERFGRGKIIQCLRGVLGEASLAFSKNDGKPCKGFEQRRGMTLSYKRTLRLLVGEWTLVGKSKNRRPVRSLLENGWGRQEEALPVDRLGR